MLLIILWNNIISVHYCIPFCPGHHMVVKNSWTEFRTGFDGQCWAQHPYRALYGKKLQPCLVCPFLSIFFFPYCDFPSHLAQSISSHFQAKDNSLGIHCSCYFHGTAATPSAKLISHHLPLPLLRADWNNYSFLKPTFTPAITNLLRADPASLAGSKSEPWKVFAKVFLESRPQIKRVLQLCVHWL